MLLSFKKCSQEDIIIHDYKGTNYKAKWSYTTEQFVSWAKDVLKLT